MAKASLYTVSARAYFYLRDSCKLPFPCKTTILKWSAQIHTPPGTLQPILDLLKEKFNGASPMEKQPIICFDEVGIDGKVCLDEREQKLYGPHKKLLAVFLRGLFYSWKQLVYYEFDKQMKGPLLLDIISDVQKAGLDIVGSVCDLDGGNRGVLRDLGINVTKNIFSFPNPITERPVWFFADFCHLLKRLRDNFLDYYFELGDGTRVEKSMIEELIKTDKQELKIAFKVTNKHLTLQGKERMNVRTAFELFSNTVATALEFTNKNCKKQAEFFRLINDYSDLLNSRTSQLNAKPYKCTFGVGMEKQIELLDKVTATIAGMRVGDLPKKKKKTKALFPFQKGVILTNTSLKGLYHQLRNNEVQAAYIMTSHLNQDFVESAFSSFRGFGGFTNNPSPNKAIGRVKSLIISMNLYKPRNTNSKTSDDPQLSSQNLRLLMESHETNRLVPNDLLSDEDEKLDEVNPFELATWAVNSLSRSDKCERGGQEYAF